ncbi:hypothetical protein TCE0_034r11470 [Talaromyces pinophilus]|uniref:Uncharacterized protein n=1 Tax=Talaromyces pinophilus TaxID=128442 RepID=A0A6V8HDZ7_TALPI|nr:hypothetical protein TCE0_034r11470 [Talaromyces pinophilus]
MAPRNSLTPIDAGTVLQHGMPFVVKWRNPATSRLDFWIGIYFPDSFAYGVRKPKVTADADPEDQKSHLMYLPGRNIYRWIEMKCLYPLSAIPPVDYEQAGREYPDVYSRLYTLAEKAADMRYWGAVAREERKVKGRNGKIPSIDFDTADDDAGDSQESEADPELDNEDEVTSNLAGEIDGSVYSSGAPQGQMVAAKRPLREGSVFTATKKAKTSTSAAQHPRPQLQAAREPDGDEVVDIYIGNGMNQKVFHLSRNNINKSSFLKGHIQGKFPYIFHPILHQMSPAEFEPVHAFLSHDDGLDSDLVLVYGDGAGDNDNDGEDILGDVDKMGKYWKIKEVHNIEELKAYILQLGPTYAQACLLGLFEMASTVIANVQVAWNVYGRVDQLPIFLDFIEGVIQDSARGSALGAFHWGRSSFGLGAPQQSWIVKFLAETLVLYTSENPQRFWSLMDKYPGLRAAVFKHRGALDDAKLRELEKNFLQREPLTDADFVIPAKMAEGVEQEAVVKDGEGMEQVVEANE